MSINIQCPSCGETFDLREARNDDDWRAFVAVLVQFPQVLQAPLLAYMEVFRPAKQPNVRSATMRSVAEELFPLVKAQEISRNRIKYSIPHADWSAAFRYLANNTALKRPLKGNGYLLETLASRAEKLANQAEKKQMDDLRYQHSRQGGMRKAGDVMIATHTGDGRQETPKGEPEISEEQRHKNLMRLSSMLSDGLKDGDNG